MTFFLPLRPFVFRVFLDKNQIRRHIILQLTDATCVSFTFFSPALSLPPPSNTEVYSSLLSENYPALIDMPRLPPRLVRSDAAY